MPDETTRNAAESRGPTLCCYACGSHDLAMVSIFAGYSRKQCVACHSTGPFVPYSGRSLELARMTSKELEERVAEFCDEPDPDAGRDSDRDTAAIDESRRDGEDASTLKGTG